MLQYIPVIGSLIEKWLENKKEGSSQHHDEQMAVYNQFASEFRDLSTRTYWDSFVDGINRLPRSIMTFGLIYLFYYCWTDPEAFIKGATALQAMPYEGWVALWMILGFWFGTKAIQYLPSKFGKLDGLPKIEKVNQLINNTISNTENNETNEEHNEGLTWEERKEIRYNHEDNNRYND